MILTAVSCIAAFTPLLAQQASDSASVTQASQASVNAPRSLQSVPHQAPRFESFQPVLPRSTQPLTAPLAEAGGQHTVVFSTLALVLAVIIVVLLVVN
jgi:hypothetical protein